MLMRLLSWWCSLLSYHILQSPLEIFQFTTVQFRYWNVPFMMRLNSKFWHRDMP